MFTRLSTKQADRGLRRGTFSLFLSVRVAPCRVRCWRHYRCYLGGYEGGGALNKLIRSRDRNSLLSWTTDFHY